MHMNTGVHAPTHTYIHTYTQYTHAHTIHTYTIHNRFEGGEPRVQLIDYGEMNDVANNHISHCNTPLYAPHEAMTRKDFSAEYPEV